MSSPSLPPHLREKIAQGQAILFLGAGATRGAKGPDGEQAMDANRLRDTLADKFLGGALKDRSLTYVADICKSESSLSDVQLFISDIFAKLRPAPFHLLVPCFRWYAIVTTNYDLVVERAYEQADHPVQKLRPIIRDGDNFSKVLSELDSVPYLKLHGCLRHATDARLPLILASEEYAKHRENRKRLFQHFHDWALEHPIIFCGYDLSDPNIAQILFDIGDDAQHRPQYALVRPNISDIEQRHWSARRITPISSTFEQFINYLNAEIPEHERVLGIALTDSHPLSRWTSRGAPSVNLLNYLENELTLITENIASTPLRPRDFYSGIDSSWRFCSENFDIERRISDTVVLEALLEQPLDPGPRFYVVLGHAGSGKSILLRRIAWQAAITHKTLAFYLEPGGTLRTDLLIELFNLTEEPFSIFVDDVLRSTSEVGAALPKLARYRIPCVLIGASRTNEWNVYGEELNRLSLKTFELGDLSEREIQNLLDKLSRFNCLGVLGDIPESDRPKYLRVTAERQLLVALLEATHGRPLAEIVLDEFRNIVPAEARTLYLDVCTLNRFGVPVRAGLISRVSGIPFHAFQTRLIAPLEHVVHANFDAKSRDYAYRARHRDVAKIVFEQVLADPERRVDQLARLIANMDVDYASDEEAFSQIIRGKKVADAFSNRNLGEKLYEAAKNSTADDSYILQQQAVFELNHPNGDSRKAQKYIGEAERRASRISKSLLHTKANVLRRLASEATNHLEKDKYRQDAKHILKSQIGGGNSQRAYTTLARLLLDEVKEGSGDEALDDALGSIRERVFGDAVSELDSILFRGLQEHPGDEFLLATEAEYADWLGQRPKAVAALERAYRSSSKSCFVAVALAKQYARTSEYEKACSVLSECLEMHPTSKPAHLRLALVYQQIDARGKREAIGSHLRKSFTDGDSNYDAQFWYARHQFLFGDTNVARRYFGDLKRARVPPGYRQKVRGTVCDQSGKPVRFEGRVKSYFETYCFLETPELRDDIYLNYRDLDDGTPDDVRANISVRFDLGFALPGPVAKNANIARG